MTKERLSHSLHGAVLRALAEASSQDEEAKEAWRDFLEPVVVGHADKIREAISQGRVSGLDPNPTARALFGMNLQVFFDEVVGKPEADVEAVAETLLTIWRRALYGSVEGSD